MNIDIFQREMKSKWSASGLQDKIINGVYILYDKYNVQQISIIDTNLQEEPFPTVLKSLLPLIVKHNNFWNEDEKRKTIPVVYGFIDQLKQKETFHPTILKTILTYGSGFTHLQSSIFPLFAKKIISVQDLDQDVLINNKTFNFKTRKFSNDFLIELVDSSLYTLDNILDNIDLFDTDYASSFLKFKNIYPYIASITWTPEKMNRQKLSFNDILSNIQYFSHECIQWYSIIHCTTQEKQTLLLVKEMI